MYALYNLKIHTSPASGHYTVCSFQGNLNLKHNITAGLKFHQLFLHIWQLCCIFNFYVHSFELFVKLFLVMAIDWLFLLLSWLPYPVLMYCHIVMNAFLALVFLYICILSQRRVTLLIRQACCCCQPSEPVNTVEWGEEMSSMNTAIFWVHFLSVMTVVFNSMWQHFISDTDINLCHWQRTRCLSPAKPDVRLPQQCCWRLKYSEMWHCVGQVICNV